MLGAGTKVSPSLMTALFAKQMRRVTELDDEMKEYDRMKEGTEKKTYAWLREQADALIERRRVKAIRAQQQAALNGNLSGVRALTAGVDKDDEKKAAAAEKNRKKQLADNAVKKAAAAVRTGSAGSGKSDVDKVRVCFKFADGKCEDKNCIYSHDAKLVKQHLADKAAGKQKGGRGRSPKASGERGRSPSPPADKLKTVQCKFEKTKEGCGKGDACTFKHTGKRPGVVAVLIAAAATLSAATAMPCMPTSTFAALHGFDLCNKSASKVTFNHASLWDEYVVPRIDIGATSEYWQNINTTRTSIGVYCPAFQIPLNDHDWKPYLRESNESHRLAAAEARVLAIQLGHTVPALVSAKAATYVLDSGTALHLLSAPDAKEQKAKMSELAHPVR